MAVSLIDMPEVVMNRLFEELDFREIMTLRKVNHALRDFIDVNQPDGKFIRLSVSLQTNKAILSYRNASKEDRRFECIGTDDGCYVKYENKQIQMSGTFYEQMLKDLKFIFKFQKTCLERFKIKGNNECEDTIYNKFLGDLAHMLDPSSLKVTKFNIGSNDPVPILKSLNAKFLKSLDISKVAKNDEIHQIYIGDIKNLEVWKNLEIVKIFDRAIHNGEIYDFLKFKEVFVMFDTITENQLKDILETFLTSPTIREFHMRYINLDRDVECFGEPDTLGGQEGPLFWFFEIPESTDVVWISHWKRHQKQFDFFRVDRGMILAGATIQT